VLAVLYSLCDPCYDIIIKNGGPIMYNGLWSVEFETTGEYGTGRYGTGVVVINENSILGGDAAYYYKGTWEITSGKIKGELLVIRYDSNGISVFGDISQFNLMIDGDINEYQFVAVGSIADNPQDQIRFTGTKREDL